MGANAQTSVPAFTAGQVLTAAQMTQVNTGIPVFASSTERDAAFGGTGEKTLAEGQMAYLEDTNATQYYDGSSWAAVAGGKILQVVRATDTSDRATTSTSFVDVSGMTVTITPTKADSTILIVASCSVSLLRATASVGAVLQITDSSNNTISGAENDVIDATGGVTYYSSPVVLIAYDSPATTSATTYKLRFRSVNVAITTTIENASQTGQMFALEISA